ncbi:integrase catalytic domain-containing protein [Trichonephila clavipes]|uniref:Integrase catalytic domain-containing protein n=1 Tax=Trichonephila clavipes TaxID=2585209 RepID=A0A8X6VCJ9_TRICX|nr:integrase catalytic domain-containing protein [Trichonephila clavipes]
MIGDLPIERINPCRAFEKVGIDIAGPTTTKCQHTRKANNFKFYICLFIRMCTKAMHLEVVSSLSAAAFLSALRRFVSRRGYSSDPKDL